MRNGQPWMIQTIILIISILNVVDPSPISINEIVDISTNKMKDFSPIQINHPVQQGQERFLSSLGDGFDTSQVGDRVFKRKRRGGNCMFNSLAYNCDFKDAIGAANEASYWGSSSPGKRKRSGDRPAKKIGLFYY